MDCNYIHNGPCVSMIGMWFSISTIKWDSHLNATGGVDGPRPVFLILLVGNTHNHVGDHMIRKKAMLDDSVQLL